MTIETTDALSRRGEGKTQAKRGTAALLLVAMIALPAAAGCGSKRPALYPNAKLDSVTAAQAEADVDACIAKAADAGYETSEAKETATSTATGAAIGGAVGAATGAVRSGNKAGKFAARGAAGGAAAGFVRSILRRRDPDPLQKSFVDQCLREKGYKTLGWQ